MFRPPPRGYSASELPPKVWDCCRKAEARPGAWPGFCTSAQARPRHLGRPRRPPSCRPLLSRGDGAESVSEDSRRARRRWLGGSRIVAENVATVSVRYIADDVDSAIEFYLRALDFE